MSASASKQEVWTSNKIADQLFLEMCEHGPTVDDPGILSKNTNGGRINYYYLEAARYAFRISAGNFEAENKQYKPVFRLYSEHFSAELRVALSDRLRTSKESLHDVVQEGVFKLFRSRHKMIFYEHIEIEPLGWELI
jgi:hypothetical protein